MRFLRKHWFERFGVSVMLRGLGLIGVAVLARGFASMTFWFGLLGEFGALYLGISLRGGLRREPTKPAQAPIGLGAAALGAASFVAPAMLRLALRCGTIGLGANPDADPPPAS